MFGFVIQKHGDLSSISASVQEPNLFVGTDGVLVKNLTMGVNYDDILALKNLYPFDYTRHLKNAGNLIGLEGVGIVERVGTNVKEFSKNQRVAYAFGVMGSFAEYKVLHQNLLVPVPDTIDNDTMASCFRKALWIHSLLYRIVSIKEKSPIMIHNVTDPLESMLCKWSLGVGLKVVGTVDGPAYVEVARQIGCDLVIEKKDPNAFDMVKDFTQGMGVKVLFDSAGAGVEDLSLRCLQPFGTYVHYLGKNGAPKLPIDILAKKCLFLTYPVLEVYKANKIELRLGAESIFSAVAKGYLKNDFKLIPLKKAKDALLLIDEGRLKKNVVLFNEVV